MKSQEFLAKKIENLAHPKIAILPPVLALNRSSKSQIAARYTLRYGTQFPKSHWPLSFNAPKSQRFKSRRLHEANSTKSQTLAFYINRSVLVPLRAWESGEGLDSARGVAAKVVCCRNSSCNSSCDAIARKGRRTIAFFLLFRVRYLVCQRLCEGIIQTCVKCGRRGQVLQPHPLPISHLLQTLEWLVSPQHFANDSASQEFRCDTVLFPSAPWTHE